MRIHQYEISEPPVVIGEIDPLAPECNDTYEVKMNNRTQECRGDVSVTEKQVELQLERLTARHKGWEDRERKLNKLLA